MTSLISVPNMTCSFVALYPGQPGRTDFFSWPDSLSKSRGRGETGMIWNAGDSLELTLHGLAHDGRAVARPENGPVVFVRGGLPGQRILARLTAVKKRMAEAEMLNVVAPAEDERPAPAPPRGGLRRLPLAEPALPRSTGLEAASAHGRPGPHRRRQGCGNADAASPALPRQRFWTG